MTRNFYIASAFVAGSFVLGFLASRANQSPSDPTRVLAIDFRDATWMNGERYQGLRTVSIWYNDTPVRKGSVESGTQLLVLRGELNGQPLTVGVEMEQ